MPKRRPSSILRAALRRKIRERVAELDVTAAAAARRLGLSPAQMSRLNRDEDIFTLDRLIDAAARIGLTTRLTATRPYRAG